jgi:hypothetical protein
MSFTNFIRETLEETDFLDNNENDERKSFFDHTYKNYKPFSRLTKKINFNNFKLKSNIKLNLSDSVGSYGDLITNLTVEIKMPEIFSSIRKKYGYTNALSHALFEYIELRIGGNLIDTQTSEWMDVWSELTVKPGLQKNYNYLIKKFESVDKNNFKGINTTTSSSVIYLPLHFWFCKNSSTNNTMSFPIGALYNSDVELHFNIRSAEDLVIDSLNGLTVEKNSINSKITEMNDQILEANLLVDYIILDEKSAEDLKTKQEQYYLITQVQENTRNIDVNTSNIIFPKINYLVTELIWVVINDDAAKNKNLYFSYGTDTTVNSKDPIKTTSIKFNGNERIEKLPSEYFQSVEPLIVHDNTPYSFVHCYSFSLNPEDFSQPSGICNFNEISDIRFELEMDSTISDSTFKLYAINYNVLVINNGEGTLKYK